jgi:hypothetical protein
MLAMKFVAHTMMVIAVAACSAGPMPDTRAVAADAAAMTPIPKGEGNAAGGSGCAIKAADSLPNGVWFGFAKSWDDSGIDFDLACFYTGDAAYAAAAARGEEQPPSDFLVVNDAHATRRVEMSADAVAYRFGATGLERTTFADLRVNPGTYQTCPGEWCAVWLFVEDGRANELQPQYLP